MNNLSELSISNIQSYKLENNTLIISAWSLGDLINIEFHYIWNLNYSKDYKDIDDSELVVFEVTHHYETTSKEGMPHYEYLVDFSQSKPKLHKVTIEGTIVFRIVCQEILIDGKKLQETNSRHESTG